MLTPSQRQQLSQTLRVRLCQLRDEMRLTDAAWARLAHVRQQDVSRYTRGAMTYPTLEFLDALAAAFHLTLGEVLVERYPNPTQNTLGRRELRVLLALREMKPKKRAALELLVLGEEHPLPQNHAAPAALPSRSVRRKSPGIGNEEA